MKTIIAGGRDITDEKLLLRALDSIGWEISEVVCGCAKGADTLGHDWALENNIPIVLMAAKWHKYGRGAGHIRNAEMANYAEALIALWDGHSKGTANMIDLARTNNLKVYVELI